MNEWTIHFFFTLVTEEEHSFVRYSLLELRSATRSFVFHFGNYSGHLHANQEGGLTWQKGGYFAGCNGASVRVERCGVQRRGAGGLGACAAPAACGHTAHRVGGVGGPVHFFFIHFQHPPRPFVYFFFIPAAIPPVRSFLFHFETGSERTSLQPATDRTTPPIAPLF